MATSECGKKSNVNEFTAAGTERCGEFEESKVDRRCRDPSTERPDAQKPRGKKNRAALAGMTLFRTAKHEGTAVPSFARTSLKVGLYKIKEAAKSRPYSITKTNQWL